MTQFVDHRQFGLSKKKNEPTKTELIKNSVDKIPISQDDYHEWSVVVDVASR